MNCQRCQIEDARYVCLMRKSDLAYWKEWLCDFCIEIAQVEAGFRITPAPLPTQIIDLERP